MQSVHPKSRKEWREWLRRNHKETKVCLIIYKKHTGKPVISHKESMEDAISYGWIDTTVKRLDEERYQRCFVKRNENSRWSKATLSYAEELIKKKKMTKEGMKWYKEGKKKDTIDHGFPKNPEIPEDLKRVLKGETKKFFESLAPSYRRNFIYWVLKAKRNETREKRIKEIVKRCSEKSKW